MHIPFLRQRLPVRVLIAGSGKSGTTGLFFRIKNSLPAETMSSFEPMGIEPFAGGLAKGVPLIAKVLLPLDERFFNQLKQSFNKKILIVRDPRDVVVSALLYTTAHDFVWKRPPSEIAACIELLREKEADPNGIPALRLFRALWDDFDHDSFSRYAAAVLDSVVAVAEGKDFFVLKYEDFIQGKLSPLGHYLGLQLVPCDDIDEGFQRVIRTKGSGSWKHWFLDEDIEYFRPLLTPFMERFGYPLNWTPQQHRVIKPEHGSGYLLRVLNERRLAHDLEPISNPESR